MTRPETDSSYRGAFSFAPEVYRGADDRGAASELDALRIELRAEVRALRTLVARKDPARELALELASIRAALDEMGQPSAPKRDRISAWLRARGIEGLAATRIAGRARKDSENESIDAVMRSAIPSVLRCQPWASGGERRRVIALVGPSGVGKTTTAAKLAARERMAGRSVALVSCDGFRVGAVDQLERYAELLGASFHVAERGSELREILAALTCDVVFVDTSGRPPATDGPEATLAALARQAAPRTTTLLEGNECPTTAGANPNADEFVTILCMTATTRAADAARIAATYAPAVPTLVCVTKTDETRTPSALVHAPVAAKLPIALISTGPRVPEDIEPATEGAVFAHLSIAQGATT